MHSRIRAAPVALRRLCLLLLAWLLTACAGLPPQDLPRPTATLVAAQESQLGLAACRAGLGPQQSGFWPLPQAEYALDARIALIRHATRSIDLQTYLIGLDGVGMRVLRELRDAAARGVRVRLLLDDLHTLGQDAWLLGLAAHDGAQVRLFNPFTLGRATSGGRLWGLLADGHRLNHRMHNKLLVVDGLLAVVGGRNLADEYFMLNAEGNFVDWDFLVAGALVPQLSAIFDQYWNNDRLRDIAAVASDGLTRAERRMHLDGVLAVVADAPAPTGPDIYGNPAVGTALIGGRHGFRPVMAMAFADAPDKVFDSNAVTQPVDTALSWSEQHARSARTELLVVSPYFLPDRGLRQGIHAADARGVRTLILTNGIAASDEPLVSFVSQRYRDELLSGNVRLFEINPQPEQRNAFTDTPHRNSTVRLHTKGGVIDRQRILLGSANLDPRSQNINTELAILVSSPEMAQDLASSFHQMIGTDAVHEVERAEQGRFRWRLRRPTAQDALLDEAPGYTTWSRLRLFLLSLLVPEEML